MRVAAVIQARMKSTRLPGKVLMNLAGRPVLKHIIDRLRRVPEIDEIAIATSTEPEDAPIAAFALREGVHIFRGPEEDVLERFKLAAEALMPDVILRVTGDSPLIDPPFVRYLLREMNEAEADFLMPEEGVRCIQEGIDPFSHRALEVLLKEASSDPVAREHVTGWFKLHPEKVRVRHIAIPADYEFSGARLSVDTPADLEFLEAVHARLELSAASLPEIATLLRREPWLMTINAHVRQKPATQGQATVLIRADGGGRLGYGHLTRTLALAESLRDDQGIGVVVLTGVNPQGDAEAARAFFAAHKIPVLTKAPSESEPDFIGEALRKTRALSLILDVRTELSRRALEALRVRDVAIVTIDDGSDRRLAADIAAYPAGPRVESMDWTGFSGRRLAGPEWTIIAPDVARVAAQPPSSAARTRLLVSLGGSDPMNLTGPIAAACAKAMNEGIPTDVVIGPGVQNAEEVAHQLERVPGVAVHLHPRNPVAIYAQAALAVVSFGVTAFELAALGVPALYIALSDDHRLSAEGAEALGFGRVVAMAQDISPQRVAWATKLLSADSASLRKMATAGRAQIDGKGASRLASEVGKLIEARARERAEHRDLSETRQPSLQAAVCG